MTNPTTTRSTTRMTTRSRRVNGVLITGALLGSIGFVFSGAAFGVYAIAQYGEPKYPPGFQHFD